MIIWVVCSLMLVVGVKYYTSLELRKLERRLERVKDGLQQVKEKFQMAQDRQQSVQSEESLFEERVKFMQENIQDIQFRLTSSEDVDEEGVMVSDSAPPPNF